MLAEYIKNKGLTVQLVAQQMGVRNKTLYAYGRGDTPTVKTLQRLASAMTELGVPTTVVELVPLFEGYVTGE